MPRVARRPAAAPLRKPRSSYRGYGAYSYSRAAPRSRMSYRRPAYRGRGAYYIQGGAYGRAKLPGIGKVGGFLGGGYTSGSQNYPVMKGLGAYSVSAIKHNVLIKPELPEMRNAIYAEGGTIVRHREYLGAITTSSTAGAFKIETYPLNPAQSVTFPWLSTIAQNYEEYKPNGLVFEFRSTASDAIASSTNLALGQVMMCTQYDPTDPDFTSDVELLNYTWAQSGKVSDCVQHYVECDPKQSPLSHLYTRPGSEASSSDLRFSDFGTFSIATSGLQGTSVQVGQLWVTYEFILYKPKIGGLQATNGGWFHFGDGSGSASNLNPFGSDPMGSGVFDDENNLNITLSDYVNYGRISFPVVNVPTSFSIFCVWRGDSTASVQAPAVAAGDTAVDYIKHNDDNSNAYVLQPYPSATSTMCSIMTWVSIPADGAVHTVDISLGTIPTNSTCDVYITQIPYLDPAIYG